jgi:hypothetical protein
MAATKCGFAKGIYLLYMYMRSRNALFAMSSEVGWYSWVLCVCCIVQGMSAHQARLPQQLHLPALARH